MRQTTEKAGLFSARLGPVVALTALCLVMVPVYWLFVRPMFLAPIRRQVIEQLATELEIGQSRTVVRQIYQAASPPDVALDDSRPGYWAFESPTQFGATYWILVVSFEEDTVNGIGVRTADSLKAKPAEGPADRVADGEEGRWFRRFGPLGKN